MLDECIKVVNNASFWKKCHSPKCGLKIYNRKPAVVEAYLGPPKYIFDFEIKNLNRDHELYNLL